MQVLHYINQFFGGIGGEEQAGLPPEVREGAVGPGRLLDEILGDDHRVVATLICGDNFFQEQRDEAVAALTQAIADTKPDVVIAGPAFVSGRYGIACAEVAKVARDAGVVGLAGMNAENPAGPMYASRMHIAATGPSPATMEAALRGMARLANRLVAGEELGAAGDEGYLPRGIRRHGFRDEPGYLRAVNMLEKKLRGEPIHSEIPYQPLDKVESAPVITNMGGATIALASTGGLIRAGNPDNQPERNSRSFLRISVDDLKELSPGDFDAYHAGYFTDLASGNPNYILPLGYARELQDQGEIGNVHSTVYGLAGVSTPVAECRRMGRVIGEDLAKAGVDGCLLVAT